MVDSCWDAGPAAVTPPVVPTVQDWTRPLLVTVIRPGLLLMVVACRLLIVVGQPGGMESDSGAPAIDAELKDLIKGDAQGGNLIANGVVLSERYQGAIDIDNLTNLPGSVNAYDLTTPGAWAQHVRDYVRYGEIRLVSWPTIERAMIQLRGGGTLGDGGGGGGGE